MRLVDDFLRQEYKRTISLEDAARVAGVHPVYLSRMFRLYN